jgi:uncharacterized protein involved in outer membrane biogenesis
MIMKKKVAIVFAVLVGIILLVTLALEFVLDLNSYNPKITALAENALHRKVKLGNISHTLLRGPGAKVQDVTIFEQDQSSLFVQVKDIIARVKILPLFSKKIEVSKILLDKPVVMIKRDSEGGWNFGDLLGKPAEAAPQTGEAPGTPPSATQPAEGVPKGTSTASKSSETGQTPEKKPSPLSQLAIDTFSLTDGTIRFVDEKANVTTEMSGITGDVSGIAVDSPILFQLAANVDGGEQGKIKASGQIGPIPANGNVENLDLDVTAKLEQIDLAHFSPYYQQHAALSSPEGAGKLDATIQVAGNIGEQLASTGNVSVGGVNVDVSGTVQEVKTTPKLDLTISSQELSWEKLLQLLPPDLAKQIKDFGLSGMGSIKLQPKGSLDNLVIAGEFDLSKSGIQYQQIFAKPEAMLTTLAFETAVKPDALDVSSLKLTVGDFALNVSGTVTNFKEPVLDLQLSSNEFPLAKLLALFPDIAKASGAEKTQITSGGTGILRASAKGSIQDLALQLMVDFDKSDIGYRDLFTKSPQSAANLNVEARLGKDSVSIGKLLLHLGEFQLTTTGTITNFKQPQLNLVLDTNSFDLQALFAHFPILQTSLPKELTLEGPGKLHVVPVGSLEDLAISGSIDLSQGKIAFGEYFIKSKDIPGIVEFDMTRKKDAIEIRRAQINLNGVLFDIKGLISGLQQQAMLDLSVTSNKFSLNQLRPMQGMKIDPTGTTELNLKLKTPLAKIDPASLVTGTLRLSDVGFLVPQLNKPVQHLNAFVEIQGENVTLQKFSATVGESSLNGEATINRLFTAPNIAFTFHASQLNLDEFMTAPVKKVEKTLRKPEFVVNLHSLRSPMANSSPFLLVASQKEAKVPTPPSKPDPGRQEKPRTSQGAGFLSQIAANGTVKVDRGQAKNVHFTDLSADVKMEQGVLHADNLLFNLYDGTYQGFVKLDLNDPDPKYEFHSELSHVNTNPMLAESTSLADVVYGFLFADASIQGQGFKTEQVVKTLSGKGVVKIEQGKFTTLDICSKLAPIFQLLGSVGKSKALAQIGDDLSKFPKETQFARFEGNFELKNGSAGSSDLILDIPGQDMYLTLSLEGKFGLDTSLDFIGKVRFAPQSKYYNDIEKNFRNFKQADGSIELPFPIPIGGTLLKPEINLQSAQKSVATFATELAKQAVTSQVEKEVLKLLQGKSSPEASTPTPEAQQTPTAQTPTPTPTPKKEDTLEKAGKELLKDLFKKKKK